MFVAFDPAIDWKSYDFAIIGSGPAGLLLADRLSSRGKVLILEAGGRDLSDSWGQGYYDLDVTGRGYATVGERLMVFGGTSNHWGGHSHPLSPLIFANRAGFPGWPISYADYSLHLKEAQDWLNLKPFDKTPPLSGVERDLLGRAQNLGALHFQFSNPLRHFGDDDTQARYAARPGIDIVLGTRVIDLHLDQDGNSVEQLDLFHLPSGATVTIPVKMLFLAAGGIENPRLMLWAARKYATGNPLAGGPNQLTGKYFMEHPSLSPVEIYIDARADVSALKPHLQGDQMVNVVLRPTDEFLAAHGLPRFAMHFQETPQPATQDIEIRTGEGFFVNKSTSYLRILPFFIFEQTPDPESYVGLSSKLGKDGTPLAKLHWRISDEEVQRYRHGVQMFCGLLNQYGLAKARFVGDAVKPDWTTLGFGGAAHHMGTTRMAHSAAGGVVDSNQQVFGLDNMFVAGSSVFPSTDIVNPTMNLTALTARLANYLLTRAATAVGGVYRFGSGRDSNKALGKGWSTPVFEGIWSNADVASLSLDRNEASTLAIQGTATGQAQVELEINGASVYTGPANGLAGKPFAVSGADELNLTFHFTNLPAPDPGNPDKITAEGGHGLFLQGVTLK